MDFSAFKSLLEKDRTVRRFDQSVGVSRDTLLSLVSLTRYCASGRNAQPLRYRLVNSPEECARLYPLLAWAGYYKDWDGPEEGERPTAYLVQCLDTELGPNCLCDDGLQLQALTLGATTLGLACCIIKSFNVAKTAELLSISSRFQPRYVLALGKGVEKVSIETLGADGDFKYFRTSDGVHHVPKRELEDLVI